MSDIFVSGLAEAVSQGMRAVIEKYNLPVEEALTTFSDEMKKSLQESAQK